MRSSDDAGGQGDTFIKQFGTLPYREQPDGTLSVLLITSRETQRWIVPKGNPISGLLPHETAAQEAFEEAGVIGDVDPVPIGSFSYFKRMKDGSRRHAQVDIFPLAVTQTLDAWPEQHQRELRWYDAAQAAQAVDEQSLGELIRQFEAQVSANRDRPPSLRAL